MAPREEIPLQSLFASDGQWTDTTPDNSGMLCAGGAVRAQSQLLPHRAASRHHEMLRQRRQVQRQLARGVDRAGLECLPTVSAVSTCLQVVTMPQYFKESGYLTLGSGKVFHPGKFSAVMS